MQLVQSNNATRGPSEVVSRYLEAIYYMWSENEPLRSARLADWLGVSRPTVTVVAGTLQKAGLIKYRHGRVTIVDGEKLEAASCECYRTATKLLNAVTARSTSR